MNLGELLVGCEVRECRGADVAVVDLTCDSREVRPGWAFVALKGEKSHGADFLSTALAQGASAILWDDASRTLPEGVAGALLPGARLEMGLLAKRLHGAPDERLALIGVTGTNGKTTTTTLIRQLLRASGIGCGLVGTVLNAAGDREEEAVRTTPESPSFYRWLHRSVEAGDRAAAVEVSSIGLELGRVAGARFKVGVFTNLTQDHLDYHGDMETYFRAKQALLGICDRFLVNADDPYGRRLLAEGRHRSYGLEQPADYRITDLRETATGTAFTLTTPLGAHAVASPLLGRFNVYNLLAALAAVAEAGFDLAALLPAVPKLTGAPGRLERVDCGQPFGVMVDYAHTPDALHKLLAAGKALLPAGGRLHVLFGCGGERDRTKRPLMAAAVAEGADVIWHSTDNPRHESIEQILDDAMPGIPEAIRSNPSRYHRIADRAVAVREALADCRPGDLLMLAGKGHEPYQEIAGVKHPYSDRGAVEAALKGTR
ncbi:MAG TPA: UDP-N-acetylmuramoyl-L-alanyl-D-glutamate--2,6-diaminopimelate ligase [Holophagaceae bacterium]|nr:UDP-N-acetylmuramoyl-L-alanyl-D-glutamate--2,6-diaminopimelate ligase [Holophagaceae bacterium]